jgi:glycerol-3-phosphate O-acyltransferase
VSELASLPADSVLLVQASTPTEERLIRDAASASASAGVPVVGLGPPGDPDASLPAEVLGRGGDTLLVPVRVAWLPAEHAGQRAAQLADLLPGHDPYRPSERRQQRILARQPDRARVLAGEPATLGSLRQRWAEATGGEDPEDFGAYVARRATLALDQAEYRLRGPRYKTPSLVREEILSSRRFREGLARVRADAPPSLDEAGEILDELAAGWSRRLIDVVPTIGRLIFQRGFDPQIDYDPA